jgi:hypothetical protein
VEYHYFLDAKKCVAWRQEVAYARDNATGEIGDRIPSYTRANGEEVADGNSRASFDTCEYVKRYHGVPDSSAEYVRYVLDVVAKEDMCKRSNTDKLIRPVQEGRTHLFLKTTGDQATRRSRRREFYETLRQDKIANDRGAKRPPDRFGTKENYKRQKIVHDDRFVESFPGRKMPKDNDDAIADARSTTTTSSKDDGSSEDGESLRRLSQRVANPSDVLFKENEPPVATRDTEREIRQRQAKRTFSVRNEDEFEAGEQKSRVARNGSNADVDERALISCLEHFCDPLLSEESADGTSTSWIVFERMPGSSAKIRARKPDTFGSIFLSKTELEDIGATMLCASSSSHPRTGNIATDDRERAVAKSKKMVNEAIEKNFVKEITFRNTTYVNVGKKDPIFGFFAIGSTDE